MNPAMSTMISVMSTMRRPTTTAVMVTPPFARNPSAAGAWGRAGDAGTRGRAAVASKTAVGGSF